MEGNRSLQVGLLCAVAAMAGTSTASDHPTSPQNPVETDSHLSSTPVFHRQLKTQGMVIDVSLSSFSPLGSASQGAVRAHELLQADLRFTDPTSGLPLSEVRPKAWLSLRRSDHLAEELSCRDKIRSYLKGT